MATAKSYVAIEDFSLNLMKDGKTSSVDVRVGDMLKFDGLNVECKDEIGTARALVKTIGTWIKPYGKGSEPAPSARTARVVDQPRSRNATGGKIVEHSNVSQDFDVVSQQQDDYQHLQDLVNQEEKALNVPQETKVQDDMQDIRREVKVVNDDANIVAQVSDAAQTDAAVKNTSGVQMGDQTEVKRTVISQEEAVVKETNYSNKEASVESEEKHIVVDPEATGVEVKKVVTPAINATEAKSTPTDTSEGPEISVEENVVMETEYEDAKPTDIGSTTQAQVVEKKKSAKETTSKGSVDTKAVARAAGSARAGVGGSAGYAEVIAQDEDAKVVAKTSKINKTQSSEGVVSTVSVGPSGESDVGDVEFSSNGEISMGDVQVGSGGEATATDLSGSDDIDVNDILSDM